MSINDRIRARFFSMAGNDPLLPSLIERENNDAWHFHHTRVPSIISIVRWMPFTRRFLLCSFACFFSNNQSRAFHHPIMHDHLHWLHRWARSFFFKLRWLLFLFLSLRVFPIFVDANLIWQLSFYRAINILGEWQITAELLFCHFQETISISNLWSFMTSFLTWFHRQSWVRVIVGDEKIRCDVLQMPEE